MTIMMDMEPTKLEPDTKVSTRECPGRGRGALEGSGLLNKCHGASSKENQGGSENPDRDIVTRGKYSDIGKGGPTDDRPIDCWDQDQGFLVHLCI